MPLPASWRVLTVAEHLVQCGLVVGRHGARQRHPGRHHAVQHGPTDPCRELPLVVQRRPGAVRKADDVDPLGAQRGAHRLDIGTGDGRAVVTQVTPGQGLQRLPASAQAGQALAVVGQGLPGGRFGIVGALQRGAFAGAPLVDEDQVAALAESVEAPGQRAGQLDCALAGATGKEKHRVGRLVPGQCRHHCKVNIDLPALWLARVQGPGDAAAARCKRVAAQPAGLELQGVAGPGCRGRQGQRQCRQAHPACVHAHAQASIRPNSPLAISLARSSAPPTS